MTAKIKRFYLWKPSICKTFWTTLVHARIPATFEKQGGRTCTAGQSLFYLAKIHTYSRFIP